MTQAASHKTGQATTRNFMFHAVNMAARFLCDAPLLLRHTRDPFQRALYIALFTKVSVRVFATIRRTVLEARHRRPLCRSQLAPGRSPRFHVALQPAALYAF